MNWEKWPGKTRTAKILWMPVLAALWAAMALILVAVVLALAHVDIVGN